MVAVAAPVLALVAVEELVGVVLVAAVLAEVVVVGVSVA